MSFNSDPKKQAQEVIFSRKITKGRFIWSGLAHLGEMIFIPRPYGIFYLSSIKQFVMSLEKDCLIKHFLQ